MVQGCYPTYGPDNTVLPFIVMGLPGYLLFVGWLLRTLRDSSAVLRHLYFYSLYHHCYGGYSYIGMFYPGRIHGCYVKFTHYVKVVTIGYGTSGERIKIYFMTRAGFYMFALYKIYMMICGILHKYYGGDAHVGITKRGGNIYTRGIFSVIRARGVLGYRFDHTRVVVDVIYICPCHRTQAIGARLLGFILCETSDLYGDHLGYYNFYNRFAYYRRVVGDYGRFTSGHVFRDLIKFLSDGVHTMLIGFFSDGFLASFYRDGVFIYGLIGDPQKRKSCFAQ